MIYNILSFLHSYDFVSFEYFVYIDSRPRHHEFLANLKKCLSPEDQEKFKDHKTSPFCWLETAQPGGGTLFTAKGGGDRLREWVRDAFPNNASLQVWANGSPADSDFLSTVCTGSYGNCLKNQGTAHLLANSAL